MQLSLEIGRCGWNPSRCARAGVGGTRIQHDWRSYNKGKLDITPRGAHVGTGVPLPRAGSEQTLGGRRGPADTRVWTSNLRNWEVINLCCLKPANWWHFVTAASELGHSHSGPFRVGSRILRPAPRPTRLWGRSARTKAAVARAEGLHFPGSTEVTNVESESPLP